MTLRVMPSLDISEGMAVKRVRGVRGSGVTLGDPLIIAERIYGEGYDSIHIVDLDAAEGAGRDNEAVLRALCRVGFRWVQVGGGIRTLEKASRLLSYGATAVVVSTLFYESPERFGEVVRVVGGDKVIVAVDYDERRRVLTRGWKGAAPLDVDGALELIERHELLGVLFTYTPGEGLMAGVDPSVGHYAARVKGVREYAGGVSSVKDLLFLRDAGFHYAVVGAAYHLGALRGVRYV